MSFNGFSEEDILRLKTQQTSTPATRESATNVKKAQIGAKTRRRPHYKWENAVDDHSIDVSLEKCKLSLNTTDEHNAQRTAQTFPDNAIIENDTNKANESINEIGNGNTDAVVDIKADVVGKLDESYGEGKESQLAKLEELQMTQKLMEEQNSKRKGEGTESQSAKLEELQMKQKLMEEQNRKRKEMLAKALADRTKQTEDEVLKLEKIRKELQVLDGQFSQDVAVLRKKIDQASVTYADAEKQYLRVEKEFLQAKMTLQKEKEKKELLSEHLCALITHNETRKAQKLVTLMQQLAYSDDQRAGNIDVVGNEDDNVNIELDDGRSAVVDGVDERTGKMVEVNDVS